MPTLRIKLPIPAKELRPNHTVGTRGGRMRKSKLTKEARELARHYAVLERHRHQMFSPPEWGKAVEQTIFYFPTARFMDPDNCLFSCKAYFDGIQDAGIVLDDSELIHMPVGRQRNASDPHVLISVSDDIKSFMGRVINAAE
jgi:Holliday junction resolvase RusA-like endonuclease